MADMGKSHIEEIASNDLEAFIEHEQDRGLKVTTVRTRLHSLFAFLRFLIEQDIIDGRILKRKIKLKVPDFLPRAIAPGDVRKLLGVIKEIRDRALILVLLRTGMRIGELLGLKMIDLDVHERKIHIYEGEKNYLGRVVYLSDDALMALRLWLSKRDKTKEYLFHGVRSNIVLHLGPQYLHTVFEGNRAPTQRLHDPQPSAYLCKRTAQCRHAPGMSATAVGTSRHRDDPAICTSDR